MHELKRITVIYVAILMVDFLLADIVIGTIDYIRHGNAHLVEPTFGMLVWEYSLYTVFGLYLIHALVLFFKIRSQPKVVDSETEDKNENDVNTPPNN